jgi:uncharacterized protein YjbI with pentapeptide repeats
MRVAIAARLIAGQLDPGERGVDDHRSTRRFSEKATTSGEISFMSEVIYYKGVTIEVEAALPRVTVEGQRLTVSRKDGAFTCEEAAQATGGTLQALAFAYVDQSPELVNRKAARQAHLTILAEGVEVWNAWRKHHPETRPQLYDAPLSSEEKPARLSGANFANAVLMGADLQYAHLEGANFHEANLGGANLHRAHLNGANFCTTDLFRTNLSSADLTGANLQGTQLTLTSFRGATLDGCTIYGISAWDLDLEETTQRNLIVLYQQRSGDSTRYEEGRFIVHDLRSAQFVYSLLQNENVRDALQSLTSKVVLILGRFQGGGLEVLQAVASALQGHGYVPIIFDFDEPQSRDKRQTVRMLIGLSRFVVADLSGRSVPAEIELNPLPDRVPYIPILQRGYQSYNIDFPSYVLEPIVDFDDVPGLLLKLPSDVIARAEAWAIAHDKTRRPGGAPPNEGPEPVGA